MPEGGVSCKNFSPDNFVIWARVLDLSLGLSRGLVLGLGFRKPQDVGLRWAGAAK